MRLARKQGWGGVREIVPELRALQTTLKRAPGAGKRPMTRRQRPCSNARPLPAVAWAARHWKMSKPKRNQPLPSWFICRAALA